MNEKYEELVSALYLSCENSLLGEIEELKQECELLGIEAPDDDLMLVQKVCLDSEDVRSALNKIVEIVREESGASAEVEVNTAKAEVLTRRKEADQRKKEADQRKEEATREKKRLDEEKVRRKAEFLELAQKANFHEHISEFKILSDKHHGGLERKVKNGLTNGWRPFGSLAVYHPGGNPLGPAPDYFFQAVVKFKYK